MNKNEQYFEKLKKFSFGLLVEFGSPKKGMTDRQTKIRDLLAQKPFGCKSPLVVKFASAFEGIEFDIEGRNRDYVDGMIVVPINANDYNHSYPLDVPVCMITGNTGFKIGSNTYGDSLPGRFSEVLRIGTKEDIETFYDAISKNLQMMENFLGFMRTHSNIKTD